MSFLEIKNLSYAYDEGSEVLHNINLKVEKSSITAILGLSGCGKTTLCHILAGVIPQALGGILSGQILLAGNNISKYPLAQLATKIALVMQNADYQLVTTTVEDELAFAPENHCVPPKEIKKRVDAALELLGLQKFRFHNPNHLSGGEKKLVAIASVLTLDPQVLILDEAMSHLDERGKELVHKAILILNKKGKTIIMIEHDWETVNFAEKWFIMAEGRIVKTERPATILKDFDFLQKQRFL